MKIVRDWILFKVGCLKKPLRKLCLKSDIALDYDRTKFKMVYSCCRNPNSIKGYKFFMLKEQINWPDWRGCLKFTQEVALKENTDL